MADKNQSYLSLVQGAVSLFLLYLVDVSEPGRLIEKKFQVLGTNFNTNGLWKQENLRYFFEFFPFR